VFELLPLFGKHEGNQGTLQKILGSRRPEKFKPRSIDPGDSSPHFDDDRFGGELH
jgi:hypothetical protein